MQIRLFRSITPTWLVTAGCRPSAAGYLTASILSQNRPVNLVLWAIMKPVETEQVQFDFSIDCAKKGGKMQKIFFTFCRLFRIHFRIFILILVATGFLLFAQQAGKYKRLILKDGSYELITEYSIQGDRVHFFSSERHQWEDLPYSMIDWKATESFAGKDARERSEHINEAMDRAAAERSEEDARFPLIVPGLKLPSQSGVFLLDVYQGKPELSRLNQNGADLRKNLGRNIIRGAINPIAGSKQTIELAGLHARIQSHTPVPSLYVFIDSDDPAQPYTSGTAKDHLSIVRCERKKENRIVGVINIAVYGKVKQSAQNVETNVEPVSKYWVKISPAASLAEGEYALVEYDDRGAMNQFVWDFGVNTLALPNQSLVNPDSDRSEPTLIQKPRKKD
jgi:hypothetical protein